MFGFVILILFGDQRKGHLSIILEVFKVNIK